MNAVGSDPTGMVEDYDLAVWNKELEVGITGAFLCCKVFGSPMARGGKGLIVNIASDLTIQAPDQRVYAASERIDGVTNFKPIGFRERI